jgi:hypothetical protein
MTYVPPLAPLAVLAFLGMIAVTGLALVAALLALASGRRRLLRGALAAATLVLAAYAATLVAFSLASRETVLQPGEEKVFCELDCHLAYAVIAARVEPSPARDGAGDRLVVTVRARFDERSISPNRGDSSLSPNARVAFLADDDGHVLAPLAITGEGGAGSPLAPLARPLRPGESYLTELTFAAPPRPQRSRLFLGSGDGETPILIGHENSVLHRKAWFALPPLAAGAPAS